jgi:signal transduction histidine kinase
MIHSGEQTERRSRGAVLIIDDDPRNRFVARAVLEPLGVRIHEAGSAEDALRALGDDDFAVMVLDVMLPGTSGIELLRIVRGRRLAERCAVLVLSALDSEGPYGQEARTLGAVDVLSKPFDPDVLRARVAALVDAHGLASGSGDVQTLASRARDSRTAEAIADELARTRQALEESSAETDRLLGVLGHDLRNPLSAVLIGVERVMRAEGLSDDHKKTLQRVSRSARRMAALVRDIVDYSRGASAGKAMPISCVPTNLGDVCEEVVDEIRIANPAREFTIVKRGALDGQWDRHRLEQALSNLVGNAVEHGDGAVEVMARGERDEVTLRVRNDGACIPEERLRTLFEPFKQKSKGLGLGLYIAREIVHAHRGTITVRSTASEGTSFTIRLPRLCAGAFAQG